MFRTIKGKFIFLTVFFIMLSVGLPFFFLISQFKENFHQRSVEMLETSLDMMNYALINAMMLGFQKDVQLIVEQISSKENIEHVRIFDRKGLISQSSEIDEVGKFIQVLTPRHIDVGRGGIPKRKISLSDPDGFYVAFEPIENEEKCQPCHGTEPVIAFLDIDTDLTRAESKFYTGTYHFMFLGISTTLILIIGFYIIFNFYINKPLQKFIVAVDAIERGNLNYRLPAVKPDEFGILERHFNRMVSELKLSQEKIEEFHFEQLRHADRLVTLGEMTAQVAHEINNHTAIIMSRADYLQLESLNNSQLKKYSEDLDVIFNQIGKVSAITKNILRHSKKLSKDFREVSLTEIVNDSLGIFNPILKKRDIKIEKKIDIEDDKILADPTQIDQVITNLVNNSADAIIDSGTITIELKSREDKILLSVADNGIGMEESMLDQIFSPFYSTKTGEKGTGLGLYIVSNILKNHKAKIECESKKGEGTKFKIFFPKINGKA